MANKKLKCRFCKEYFDRDSGIKVPIGFFCTIDHARQYSIAKSKKALDKATRKKHKEDKDRIKTKAQWMREAQSAFNAYIRERDKDKPCISCQRHHNGQCHAGHYKTTAAAPELRFNEDNCHKQCAPCNNHLSGNLVNYRINLIKKIGLDKVEHLEGPHQAKKYTIEQLKVIKETYKNKLKLVKM